MLNRNALLWAYFSDHCVGICETITRNVLSFGFYFIFALVLSHA